MCPRGGVSCVVSRSADAAVGAEMTDVGRPRIFLVEDHAVFRAGV